MGTQLGRTTKDLAEQRKVCESHYKSITYLEGEIVHRQSMLDNHGVLRSRATAEHPWNQPGGRDAPDEASFDALMAETDDNIGEAQFVDRDEAEIYVKNFSSSQSSSGINVGAVSSWRDG